MAKSDQEEIYSEKEPKHIERQPKSECVHLAQEAADTNISSLLLSAEAQRAEPRAS